MKAARIILWGKLPIKRSAIPELLSDVSRWPTVDASSLPAAANETYTRREEAVRIFIEESDVTLVEIRKRTGVHREQVYRLLARCISLHEDGRIQGFRGLLPYKHLKEYERFAEVKPSTPRGKGGAVGAFKALLEEYPPLKAWLVRQIKQRDRALAGDFREVRTTLPRLHKRFLEQCRIVGIKASHYPFNRDSQGYRSLQAYVHGVRSLATRDRDAQGARGAPSDSDEPLAFSAPAGRAPAPMMPFDAVQFDGHKLDIRLTLRHVDPFGMETLFELTRIFILVCLDVVTRAVLGYHIVLAAEYDSDDVARALQSCFGPHKGPSLRIPKLSVRSEGGFPSGIFPQVQYAGWRWFQYDSARANLADATLERLTDIAGCFVHCGPLGEPDERAFIERFFATLARCGLHQVPGSTGASTTDGIRALADIGTDKTLLMRVDELEQVVEVMFGDYNGQSHGGIGGRTPLEAMRYFLEKPGVLLRQLPGPKRRQLIFLQEARIVTVVGSGKTNVRPHVNFEGVRYTSDILANKPELRGKKLRIYFNTQDIRQLQAFFQDGSELGPLVASRSWRTTPHSLRQRREILRLVRAGRLIYREGQDAMEAYTVHKRRQAPRNKKAANALAEAHEVAAFAARNAPPGAVDQTCGPNSPELTANDATPRLDATGVALAADAKAGPSLKAVPKAMSISRTITFGRVP